MSRILEKLADQHEERIINVLYKLEDDVVNEITRATKGNLVSQRLAIQLQPRLRTIIESTFLNEADLLINDDYNKIAKETLDTFGKMPIPAKFKNLTDVDLATINALKTQSFSGFEDIAERFLKVINDEVYQSTIAGRPFNDMVSNIKSHINGVYKASNVTEIKELVDYINENKFDSTKKGAVEDAIRRLHTKYASDRAGNNLRRYASQIAHDSVMQFHGQFTVAKAKEAGLNHFTYTGTLVRDSRPFCVNFLNRTLSEEQIRDIWNNSAWQGKSTGDPFIVRGGYRCRHTWIPTDPAWGEETVDEVPDEPVVEEAPPSPVVDETDIFTPVNREGVTEQTIQILSTNEATKRLNKVFGDASKDDRYINKNIGHYRGSRPQDFGKVSGAKLQDRDLSMILAMMPEVEQLTKKFNVPMLRGIKGSKNERSYNANMGDGVMGVAQFFAKAGSKNIGKPLLDEKIRIKLEKDYSNITKKGLAITDKQFDIYEKFNVDNRFDFQELNNATNGIRNYTNKGFDAQKYNIAREDLHKLDIQKRDLNQQLAKISEELDGGVISPVSNWKRADGLSKRPSSAKQFETNRVDQFRATVYHEVGHHVHQQYKIKDLRTNPTFGQEPDWQQVRLPLEQRLNKVRNINDHSPSNYGATNTKEWFVENFSLYYRGKEELVAPEFLKILQEIKDDLIT